MFTTRPTLTTIDINNRSHKLYVTNKVPVYHDLYLFIMRMPIFARLRQRRRLYFAPTERAQIAKPCLPIMFLPCCYFVIERRREGRSNTIICIVQCYHSSSGGGGGSSSTTTDQTKMNQGALDGYCTSIAVEDDQVCGIEVTPSNSDDSSFTTHAVHAMSQALQAKPIFPGGAFNQIFGDNALVSSSSSVSSQEEEDGDSLSPPPIYGRTRRRPYTKGRVDNLFDFLDNEEHHKEDIKPKHSVKKQIELDQTKLLSEESIPDKDNQKDEKLSKIQHRRRPEGPRTPRKLRIAKAVVRRSQQSSTVPGSKRVRFYYPKEYINLLEPAPYNLFSSLLTQSHKALVQVLVDATDIPSLFWQRATTSAHTSPVPAEKPCTALTSRASAIVPLPLEAFKQPAIGYHCRETKLNGKEIKDVRADKTSIEGIETVHLENRMHNVTKNSSEDDEESPRGLVLLLSSEDSSEIQISETISDHTPAIKSPMNHKELSDLVADEELKDVLMRTKGGDEASFLFPSFPSDETSSTVFSDDGLGDEMRNLDTIIGGVQKDLAFADYIIKVGQTVDSERTVIEPVAAKKSRTRRDSDYVHSDTDTTMSVTDSEQSQGSQELLFQISSLSLEQNGIDGHATGGTVERTDGSDEQSVDEKPRKVRFSENNELFLFLVPSFHKDDDSYEESTTELLLSKLEEAYIAMEDLMDGLSTSCARYAEHNRREPSFKQPVRASSAHYI
jgi:hypothetical protein